MMNRYLDESELKLDGKDYLIIRESDLLGILG